LVATHSDAAKQRLQPLSYVAEPRFELQLPKCAVHVMSALGAAVVEWTAAILGITTLLQM
jgi:hypothetical protein